MVVRRSRGLSMLLLVAVAVGGGPVHGEQADQDAFLSELAADPDATVDRRRLAELMFSVARTLERDRSGVEAMQRLARVPEALGDRVGRRLAARFEEYGLSLDEFRVSASELVGQPQSRLVLYRALMEGQRTCWSLDLYHQQIATWGAGGPELRTMLPSREACGRFRTAVFHPGVESILEEALVEQVYQREEIRRLRNELRELEALVEGLLDARAEPETED